MSGASVEHLLAEHRQIHRVLAAFRMFLEQCAGKSPIDHHDIERVLISVSEGLFICHEEKEEIILLPELSRHGLSWSDGSLAHVRKDHRHGRNLFRTLYQSARQKQQWSEEARRHFVRQGTNWADFLEHHMQQEETLLFPYMDSELSEAEQQSLAQQFESLDAEFMEMPDAEKLKSERDAFVARYTESGS